MLFLDFFLSHVVELIALIIFDTLLAGVALQLPALEGEEQRGTRLNLNFARFYAKTSVYENNIARLEYRQCYILFPCGSK